MSRTAEAPALSATRVSKHFYSGAGLGALLRGQVRGRQVQALVEVSLVLGRGEVLAVLGENGAGKSTLLRLAAGLLLPDGGELRVLGQDSRQAGPELRRRVCYVTSDERSFAWRLSARENLHVFAALHGLGRAAARSRAALVLDRVGLLSEADRPVREYSSGMRQRLALARGLLGEPELMLLDEPTRGVDPAGAVHLRDLLIRLIREGQRAALLATHDPTEAATLSDRALLLGRGRVRAEGPAAALIEQLLSGSGTVPVFDKPI